MATTTAIITLVALSARTTDAVLLFWLYDRPLSLVLPSIKTSPQLLLQLSLTRTRTLCHFSFSFGIPRCL